MTQNDDDLMTPGEVGRAFHVDAKTVTRWAKARNLTVIWTPGGHRRFLRAEVEALRTPVPRRTGDADEA